MGGKKQQFVSLLVISTVVVVVAESSRRAVLVLLPEKRSCDYSGTVCVCVWRREASQREKYITTVQ